MTSRNNFRNKLHSVLYLLALGGSVLSSGCAATGMRPVSVSVPVECKETEPTRPVMPTERLVRGADGDQFTKAVQAELLRRESYEGLLVAALRSCITPIKP